VGNLNQPVDYGVALVSRIDEIIGLFCKKNPIKETLLVASGSVHQILYTHTRTHIYVCMFIYIRIIYICIYMKIITSRMGWLRSVGSIKL